MQPNILKQRLLKRVAGAAGCVALVCVMIVSYRTMRAPRIVERYSFSRDIRAGAACLNALKAAEDKWHSKHGRYATAEELRDANEGEFGTQRSRPFCDSFWFSVNVTSRSYSIQLIPASQQRLLSFFTEQGGPIRVGTRERPATRSSEALPPERHQ